MLVRLGPKGRSLASTDEPRPKTNDDAFFVFALIDLDPDGKDAHSLEELQNQYPGEPNRSARALFTPARARSLARRGYATIIE